MRFNKCMFHVYVRLNDFHFRDKDVYTGTQRGNTFPQTSSIGVSLWRGIIPGCDTRSPFQQHVLESPVSAGISLFFWFLFFFWKYISLTILKELTGNKGFVTPVTAAGLRLKVEKAPGFPERPVPGAILCRDQILLRPGAAGCAPRQPHYSASGE